MKAVETDLQPESNRLDPFFMPRSTNRSEKSDVIGFRLESSDLTELRKRAEAVGISPHLLARAYVLSALGHEDELKEELSRLRDEVIAARVDLEAATTAVLTQGGRMKAEQARQWTTENINRPVGGLNLPR